MAHGLEFIMDSIQGLENKKIHFLFVGTGAKKEATMAKAKELNLDNVTFLDPVAKSEVNKYISIIDVALVPLTKTVIHASLIPSKIFESAAMQKPMLLGVEGEAREIIEQYNAGIAFEPENKQEFLEALKQISTGSEKYTELEEGVLNWQNL
jgi:glycosyltransferase involved in cell wall biosynthesis